MAREAERGAVMVETALVVGIGLTMLLFSVQVGVLGFLQVTADAASFVDAHQNVVGALPNATNPEAGTHGIFPQIATADIAGSPAPAPIATLPVNYLYNSTNSNDVATSNQNRHGGVSMLQPIQYTTTVKPHSFFTRLGQKLGVSGADIEPQWTECGAHHDVVNSNAACGAAAPPANFQVNYFSQGENTPPFYVGFNYIQHCLDDQPWSTCSSSGGIGGTNFIALGMGEFLDVDNWTSTQAGASGVGTTLPGTTPVSTFEYTACHQRVYSQLAQFFSQYPDLISMYNAYEPAIATTLVVDPTFTDFRYWTEFDATPLNAFILPWPVTGALPSAQDALVREVYNWDAQVQQGYAPSTYKEPGQYPMYPGAGC